MSQKYTNKIIVEVPDTPTGILIRIDIITKDVKKIGRNLTAILKPSSKNAVSEIICSGYDVVCNEKCGNTMKYYYFREVKGKTLKEQNENLRKLLEEGKFTSARIGTFTNSLLGYFKDKKED